MAHTTRGRTTGSAVVGLLLALAIALAGCSDDGDDPADKDRPAGESGSAEVGTDAELGSVQGRLGKGRAADVLAQVTEVVDRWVDQAYAGDYPRSDFKVAFGDFTKDARALALQQAGILSNAEVGGDVTGVELTKRRVRVDVLAPKGKVAGATVRFRLEMEVSGGVERTDVVTGRLLLTPDRSDWKVFGFDVRRGEGGS